MESDISNGSTGAPSDKMSQENDQEASPSNSIDEDDWLVNLHVIKIV